MVMIPSVPQLALQVALPRVGDAAFDGLGFLVGGFWVAHDAQSEALYIETFWWSALGYFLRSHQTTVSKDGATVGAASGRLGRSPADQNLHIWTFTNTSAFAHVEQSQARGTGPDPSWTFTGSMEVENRTLEMRSTLTKKDENTLQVATEFKLNGAYSPPITQVYQRQPLRLLRAARD